MIPHHCIVKHDPPNSYGDCLRACIASMLDVENISDVPHFLRDGDQERSDKEIKSFLLSRGLRPFIIAIPGIVTLDSLFYMMAEVNTDIEYMLFCQCGGGDHVVICKNDEMIHNPAWDNASISGPLSEDKVWAVMVFVRA